MKEEKNLDRLFQEKFKDFERHPSGAVWKNIVASKEEEKEDRKIIPLWWKLGGVAAVIALLFAAGITLFTKSPSDALENEVVTTTNESLEIESTNKGTTLKELTPTLATAEEDNNANNIKNTSQSKTAIATTIKATNNSAQNSPVITTNNTYAVAQKENKRAVNTTFNEPEQSPLVPQKNKEAILQQQLETTSSSVTQNTQDTNEINNKKSEEEEGNQKISLLDEAKRIEEASQKENEAIALLEDPNNSKRWDVGAIAAPVYYGDFGGSGIDPTFSDNSKSGDVNFSYGVQVSYTVSPKIKVRAGVNNVDLSYNTDGIAFTAGPNARRISGINYNQNAQALNIGDAGNVRKEVALQDDLFPENANTVRAINGSLQQRIGFVEIPVEAVYVLSDKRIGLQVVGGISTLLLNNNEVILNAADGLQSNLGSANGVNNVSFTTNVGLGLDYKMTDKLKLNVEPSLKYQLNAFDQSVGDFKPYFIGLYTGVSYRF